MRHEVLYVLLTIHVTAAINKISGTELQKTIFDHKLYRFLRLDLRRFFLFIRSVEHKWSRHQSFQD